MNRKRNAADSHKESYWTQSIRLYVLLLCLRVTQIFSLVLCMYLLFYSLSRFFLMDLTPINFSCSLEGMMLKLKLQYCGHLMQRVDSL